jgi:hypothetical protein
MQKDIPVNTEQQYKKMWELLIYKIQPGGTWFNETTFKLMMEIERSYLISKS